MIIIWQLKPKKLFFVSAFMNTAGESVLLRQKSTKGTGSLFHEAPIPVMTDENTSQNDNNDWSLFHRTRNDK